ncbi:MAG: methyltransferase domain-containing protein [Candidatus Aenigmarchaeota archaeon]|nr:methyltransferase domain-containing protein [Candidatus Aenigmarchaeota archaeon]
MNKIKTQSIDVVNAIELFEHVEYPEKGLKECHRVLKKRHNDSLCSFFIPYSC